MKITRNQLRQIIKEELKRTLIKEELVSGWDSKTVEDKVDMLYSIISLKPHSWWSSELEKERAS